MMVDAGLAERLREHLRAARLFPEPGLAVLAVSGGGDSLAMLDLFATLAAELGLGLVVAHADHGIAADSATVAAGVVEQARRRYGLETVVGTLRLGAGASETRARLARYRFLRAVQAERGARYLVTAHHADDQVETVLLRVLRGSAPAGLKGIDARGRGGKGLVRPLLPFRHAELLAHARGAGLVVAQDPANGDPRHLRSWVRGTLLPVVRERLGDADVALLALARHAAREVRAWDAVIDLLPGLALRCTEGRVEVARAALRGYDNTLAGRILRAAAARAGLGLAPAAAARLARFSARASSGRRLALGQGLVAEAAFDALVVARSAPAPEAFALEASRGEMAFGAISLAWRPEPAPATLPRAGWTTWLAAGGLSVRAARAGDAVSPIGGVGRRKVSRLLMEARVPRAVRPAYPVVTGGDDVLWVPGVCRAAARIPGPGTEAVRIDARAG
ncbi:MAG TPA: tRNA lysidine(34) synthetase TilS [Gemmatimonadales bacterium]|nr:tRNA lysidine(34) synthetase TilS [Gemmatimonadales bacterium]